MRKFKHRALAAVLSAMTAAALIAGCGSTEESSEETEAASEEAAEAESEAEETESEETESEAAEQEEEALTADCNNGHFVGQVEEATEVISFKGIPFAKAPVGDLRWKAPDAPDDSDETFEAKDFGKSSIQYEWPSEPASYNETGEDCLTLNVWTKDLSTTDKPVMVYFHGGGFAWGGTSDPLYDGQYFVEKNEDIVVVTANYRIGILGFIDFSHVEGGEEYEDSTCLGLLDQIQALKWVQDNIEAFGGDPSNVTIFGESAGGGTTSLLCAVDEAQGLFQKCISESGGLALTYSQEEYDAMGLTETLMEISGATNMEELLAIPEDKLIEYNEMPLDEDGTCLNDLYGMPLRGRSVVPEDPYQAIADGMGKDIIYMTGSNANEWNYWIEEMGLEDLDEAEAMWSEAVVQQKIDTLKEMASDEEDALVDDFLATQTDKDELYGKAEFANDIVFRVPALKQAALHSDAGGTSYVYYFGKESTNEKMGACHASELAYVFHNEDETIFSGDVDVALADKMNAAWANFARTGNPSIDDVEWTPYNSETRDTMVIGNDSTMKTESDWLGEQRVIIEPLLKYYIK